MTANDDNPNENAGPLRALWRLIPLSAAARGRLAGRLFSAAPWAFGWSGAFKAWRLEQARLKQRAEDAKAITYDAADDGLAGYAPLRAATPPTDLSARLIAFYSPLFCSSPEIDEWEGVSGWGSISSAKPLFKGHYQPHEPGDLGAYDLLRQPEIQIRQSELAALHGISGFCFYFYWFAGKRLLEGPIRQYAENEGATTPFCLCWANENWSRRSNGREDDVLIAQAHSPTDDLAFIAHLKSYLTNDKYIRVAGRPLVIVRRPALLPDAKATAERWRNWCRENGVGEIYLAYTQSFETEAPDTYGFDAAIEFPPNNIGLEGDADRVLDPVDGFDAKVYDWRELAVRSERYETPTYALFRGVTPSWDDTARRGASAGILLGASPSVYRQWLANAIEDTRKRVKDPSEQLVFINAWNDWAEGAHLEPDKRYGYAWLEATRRAVSPSAAVDRPKLLVVVHDLFKYGAQFLALNIAATLKEKLGIDVATVALEGGPLAAKFKAIGDLYVLDDEERSPQALFDDLKQAGYGGAIVNSAASGEIGAELAKAGLPFIGLVHEMSGVIERMALEGALRDFNTHAAEVIFPSRVVADAAARAISLPSWRREKILPQGLYKKGDIIGVDEKAAARARVIEAFGLPDDAFIVLGVGYGDERKGVDIFMDWAGAAIERFANAHFIWAGALDPAMATLASERTESSPLKERLHFPGFQERTGDLFAAAHMFALTSREDPFPSTALEALSVGTCVFMVKGTSGIEDLACESSAVTVLPDATADTFCDKIASFISMPQKLDTAAVEASALIAARFGFTSYVNNLVRAIPSISNPPDVSVVVPNYNYADYLEERLTSIINQTIPPKEIIVLDDASTDDSVEVAAAILRGCGINHRIIVNETNSGGVFNQWRKAAQFAAGDILWIAESDDVADPRFLSAATPAFADANIVMSVVGSKPIDAMGEALAESYQDDVRDISPDKWRSDYVVDGTHELKEGLAVKNTIPNVSGVLFRRLRLQEVFDAHFPQISQYRVAGDWCVYVNLLRKGGLSYRAATLNSHRRHGSSVTDSRFGLAEFAEIARMQAYVSSILDNPSDVQAQAAAYLDHLDGHFDLSARYSDEALKAARSGQPLGDWAD